MHAHAQGSVQFKDIAQGNVCVHTVHFNLIYDVICTERFTIARLFVCLFVLNSFTFAIEMR